MRYTIEDVGLAACEYLDEQQAYRNAYNEYREARNDFMEEHSVEFHEALGMREFHDATNDLYEYAMEKKKDATNALSRLKTRRRNLNI